MGIVFSKNGRYGREAESFASIHKNEGKGLAG